MENFAHTALPEEANRDWNRFTAQFQNTSYDFLKPLFGQTRFLVRYLLKNFEEEKNRLIPEAILFKTRDQIESELQAEIKAEPALEKWGKTLRRFKYREFLRLTLLDLNGGDQASVWMELSQLAELILRQVDQTILANLSEKYGRPLKADGSPCRHAILALGKLGAGELNYSSDIDLIPFYETDEGQTEKGLSLHEFFIKHAQQVTQALSGETEDGFLYRVDWELRPEGRAGTLSNSLDAMISYYENFGADWERQAYLRARPVAGSLELGDVFLKSLAPFLYRKVIDFKSLKRIRDMKAKIRLEWDRKNSCGWNVKLGAGGIREIEFFIQAFQLIYAGRLPQIRERNTLQALEKVRDADLIGRDESQSLHDAYVFLRKLEHRLQLVEERQTQLLPDEDDCHLETARRMGYSGDADQAREAFRADLNLHRGKVAALFDDLFHDDEAQAQPGGLQDPLLPYQKALDQRLAKWPSFEDTLDELRFFKKEELAKVESHEDDPAVPRAEACRRLSLVAEAIAGRALKMATDLTREKFGSPANSELATVGMGKLGGREINYQSDLDLIFIFSEPGETDGPVKISNGEYFARVVQKFISILSLTTRAGKAYAVDTELRPSGNSGPLVITLEGFMDYQRRQAQIWEKQALIKARPIGGNAAFGKLLSKQVSALLYSNPFPPEIKAEMHSLRMRVEKEVAKESDVMLDYKLGAGGILDVEFILQYLQLTKGAHIPSLQTRNTFDGLSVLYKEEILPMKQALPLVEAYTFYRSLEAKLQLVHRRPETRFHVDSPLIDQMAPYLKLRSGKELMEQIKAYRRMVREIYAALLEPS